MCGNDMHVIRSEGFCSCGYWKNGVADKPKFWQECVIALLQSGYCDPAGVNMIADEIGKLSQYRLSKAVDTELIRPDQSEQVPASHQETGNKPPPL